LPCAESPERPPLRYVRPRITDILAALIVIFIATYAAIALEHPLKINESASALIGAGLLWTIYALSVGDAQKVSEQLGESPRIKTSKLSTLIWLVGFVTFLLSAILDNLTTHPSHYLPNPHHL
jgi:Na+/H+ antiporter NhaD/arsenite permease-like protein